MELESFKSAWNLMDGKNKKKEELKRMLGENKHPVLKGIRLQLIIEICAWTFFLVVYYDIFDGHQKPFYLNLLLVIAVILLLIHSFMGYFSARNLVNGDNLRQSLAGYLSRIKRYAMLSVSSRVTAIICLLLFFMAPVTFTTSKYLLLGGMLLVIPVQVIFLRRIWMKRIKKINEDIIGLSE